MCFVRMSMQDGRTALYYASWKGHTAVVRLLLKRKADVSICKEVCYNPYNCMACSTYLVLATLPLSVCVVHSDSAVQCTVPRQGLWLHVYLYGVQHCIHLVSFTAIYAASMNIIIT